MKTRLVLLWSIVSAGIAADLPYAGKWKVNLAKSNYDQTTITIESLPGGEWRSDMFGATCKFKMDGKDYPDNLGGTAAWKVVDSNTWKEVAKLKDKITGTDTYKLSADGKTLTDTGRTMKADGGSMDNTMVYERASGGPSLAGTWKAKKMSGASEIIELAPSGANSMLYKALGVGLTCDAKLDGQDYSCSGPTLAPGFTLAMEHAAQSLDLTVKKDGKLFFKMSFTVAADGKSMTEKAPGLGTIVWDRI